MHYCRRTGEKAGRDARLDAFGTKEKTLHANLGGQ
jgi:hypothetical protein